MAHEPLGLYDTPPNRNEIRVGSAILIFLAAVVISILPVRETHVPEINAFVPVVDALIFLAELITATLLYGQAVMFRSPALVTLATGFVFSAFLLIPHALTFPGSFAPHGLLGADLNTTAWIAYARRLGFPIVVILYIQLKSAPVSMHFEGLRAAIVAAVAAAIICAGAITILTTVGHNMLPAYYTNDTDLIYRRALMFQSALLAAFVIAGALLFRKRSSVLDLWLVVAVGGWLAETVLTITLHGRFTVGWYSLFVMTLFTHLVVMLALLAETTRLYARVAISTALRNEERDARLMSMDAVAAAISHEVGQPIAAANLSATSGLRWLSGRNPNVRMAKESLRSSVDSGHRAFDVIKSIRTMFGRGGGAPSGFDLNDLARQTATLLEHDFIAKRIDVEFALDAKLPPVFADRVLMQRVLLNLYTNAIEAIDSSKRRSRAIEICSMLTNSEDVLLEVSDTGTGISAKDLPYIFNAFISTKGTGTGLGLALCRAIVEENGGKLWASSSETQKGATFHLQLPHGDLATA